MNPRKRTVLSLCLAVATVSAGLVVAAGTASAAEVSASLIAALPKPNCPAGTTALKPTTARVTPHGADVYHYATSGGAGFDAYVPPAGFRPVDASDATLVEMNLPTRPTKAADLASWRTEMTTYRGTEQPALCVDPRPASAPFGRHVQGTHVGNDHWSGYVDTQGGYDQVVAHWEQTAAYPCGCSGTPDEVTWVGLGGYNSNNLLQDGTRNYGSSSPYAWFEYLGSGGSVDIVQGVGTTIGTDVSATVRFSGGVATFQVANQGKLVIDASETGISGDYDSSTAEFINERPVYDGWYLPPLTNYRYTLWYNARVYRGGTQIDPGDSGVVGVVMTSDGSSQVPPCTTPNVMAYPANLNGQSFTNYWCRAD